MMQYTIVIRADFNQKHAEFAVYDNTGLCHNGELTLLSKDAVEQYLRSEWKGADIVWRQS